MRWRTLASVAAHLFAIALCATANAQTCVPADYARVVDDTGVALRVLNQESEAAFEQKIAALAKARGWNEVELTRQTNAILSEPEIDKLDERISELFSSVEVLGNVDAAEAADCGKLDQMRRNADLLIESMRAKSRAMFARIDAAAKPAAIAAKPADTEAKAKPPSPPAAAAKPAPIKPAPIRPAPIKPAPGQTATGSANLDQGWTAATVPAPDYQTGQPGNQPGNPAIDGSPLIIRPSSNPDTFSVEDINEAGRGFFGSISAGLASVINFAFQRAGQPNGYILGSEGGGAFIAGLRYGKGTLHLKNGVRQRIYWRGPSLGYDFGAEGSRTMFLVYNVRTDADAMGRFTGVDGSAYLVGGVGITFLRSGDVVMAPIRTGLGLRLGANIGYLKFSRTAGWNPF